MNYPNIENLLENMTRDARVHYEETKEPYWLARYGAYYEMYQVYTGKTLEDNKFKNKGGGVT